MYIDADFCSECFATLQVAFRKLAAALCDWARDAKISGRALSILVRRITRLAETRLAPLNYLHYLNVY